jgi:hypothetical protein
VGLEPAVGFLHRERPKRPELALQSLLERHTMYITAS